MVNKGYVSFMFVYEFRENGVCVSSIPCLFPFFHSLSCEGSIIEIQRNLLHFISSFIIIHDQWIANELDRG
jgi:hypothetical protein